eukprot:TRINITY_DN27078_c0_g2_i1.p1 TRINITY_DN27078_c0_g2~~TRINITY_DN27078_c0_g2_i1.p1  ORF type:complete len:290 (+),score=26.97 TRINITY_DN27078_c0_g2_i1:64-933(+)
MEGAAVYFPTHFMNLGSHYGTFFSLFTWCDSAQGGLYPEDSPSGAIRDMRRLWLTSAVMRTNTAKLMLPHAEFKHWTRVRVTPILSHVGGTSWVCNFKVTDADGQQMLAVCQTVMVATDPETFSKPIPVPHAAELRELVDTGKSQISPGNPVVELPRPSFCEPPEKRFSFSMYTRLTDCDLFGHVNNAVYATLAEESRFYTAMQGGYGEGYQKAAAHLPARSMSISYIGQAKPMDQMEVRSWAVKESEQVSSLLSTAQQYRCDFLVDQQLITQVLLEVEGEGAALTSKL